MANYTLHKAGTRGHADHGWLDSHHSFSFSAYNNPERIHFGALRVLNDDIVTGGKGFGMHRHENMEIVSIPLSGELEHKDSTGRHKIIETGDVQIMSAGSGIQHSEYNASTKNIVNFLQIWVFPKLKNISPRYDQQKFSADDLNNTLKVVVSPNDSDGGVWINQDAWFSLGNLTKGTTTNYSVKKKGNGLYAFAIKGSVAIDGNVLAQRDGLEISGVESIKVTPETDTSILLIEVPMEWD